MSQPIMVDEIMARKRAFYAAELNRYYDGADAVREEEAHQKITRAGLYASPFDKPVLGRG
jgi:hypothetical protein